MSETKLTARKLRAQIGGFDFDYGVSLYKRGGVFWISPLIGTDQRREAIRARLEALGYAPFCDGEPGTAGAYSVSVPASLTQSPGE